MFYINDDYKLRIENVNGEEKYYLRFSSMTGSMEEIEVSCEIFSLYRRDFNKPMEKQRNEKRRHIIDVDLEDIVFFHNTVSDVEEHCIEKAELKAVMDMVRTCTPIQQKRFNLHYIHGFNFSEIAKMENCDESTVRKSIKAILKMVKITS